MGLHLLLIALLVALSGCVEGSAAAVPSEGVVATAAVASASASSLATAHQVPAPTENAHAGVACAQCHNGTLPPGRDLGVATTAGCMSCHEDGGPAEVQATATALLPLHATHPGLPGQARMECAQCHTHPVGDEALTSDINGCGLCHADQLDGSPAGECTVCHIAPRQRPLTSQSLEVPHANVPWIEGGCSRCHFTVSPEIVAPAADCTGCHAPRSAAAATWPADAVTGALPADSIHGGHTRVACSSCHTQVSHQIEGMSSAVGLVCADCHAVSHALESRDVAAGVCVTCHTDTHQAQQGLLLGLVPWDANRVRPSVKFAAGISCRGCHGVAEVDFAHPDAALAGDPRRCVNCHTSEYRTVADWWQEGGDRRTGRARAWVEALQDQGSVSPDLTRAALDRIAFVETGRLVHGPRLADQVLRDAVQLVLNGAGGSASAPDLGTPPREGLCSYCHLDPEGAWSLDEMPDDFHRAALGR